MNDVFIWLKAAAATLGGVIGWYIGDISGLLIALLVLISLDYVSGVMVAIKNRRLSSAVGFVGICRKVLMLALVGVGNILDIHVVGSGSVLRSLVICYYLANEGISLIENASALGLPVPAKLQDFFVQLKDKAENHDTEKED